MKTVFENTVRFVQNTESVIKHTSVPHPITELRKNLFSNLSSVDFYLAVRIVLPHTLTSFYEQHVKVKAGDILMNRTKQNVLHSKP